MPESITSRYDIRCSGIAGSTIGLNFRGGILNKSKARIYREFCAVLFVNPNSENFSFFD